MTTQHNDVGVVGLGVMGAHLALNLADRGLRVAGLDTDPDKAATLDAEHPDGSFADPAGAFSPTADAAGFVGSLTSPRVAIILVPAGRPTDGAIDALADRFAPGDIIIDGGNANWHDTERRLEALKSKGIHFVGCGVSGGEVGARFGPSLMPGGDEGAWERIRPMLESIASKVDPASGREIEWRGDGPAPSLEGHDACVAWIGPGGSGHFVKMVHNGIEYADMQLICEAYDILRTIGGLEPARIAEVFSRYQDGDLSSYLVQITADILDQADPETGAPFVDVVLDAAGQKGTGKWTVTEALDAGRPTPTIGEAVFARFISSLVDDRQRAAKVLTGPDAPSFIDAGELIDLVGDALYCAKLCAYAQGFDLIEGVSNQQGWGVERTALARIWRGGCIIRADLLHRIAEASAAPNLLEDPTFAERLARRQHAWRRVVALSAQSGVPAPALGASLAYYDAWRSPRTSANLLQAQRDYFGSHTYERVDKPRGKRFHLDWSGDRHQREV